MNQLLELPEPIFAALQEAARAGGKTPAEWIASRLAESRPPAPATLADLFAGRIGRIASGGRERLSEEGGRSFADHLEAKRHAGRL